MEGITISSKLLITIVIVALWDFIWKIIALWKAARNGHLGLFIGIADLNTVGILPIIYILMNRTKQ